MIEPSSAFRSGLWATVGAFLVWGILPIYWKWLGHVPALEVMSHRLVWCFVFVAGYLTARHGSRWWRAVVAEPQAFGLLTLSAVLIAVNWWLYIWAVSTDRIVETSLGYFINPLVNVVLGLVVLGERLNGWQRLAVVIAASGVVFLTVQASGPPWIALGLAVSFGFYGLIRKVVRVESIAALGIESLVLVAPLALYLVWVHVAGAGAFTRAGLGTDVLLAGSGLVTAVPLVLFAYGAQRIPYTLVGILQYMAPTLQLGCGVLLYGEPFSRHQAIGFGCIWVALAVYAGDGLARSRANGRSTEDRRRWDRGRRTDH